MAKVPSRLLVIDASIARASGYASAHPTAHNCCEFLRAVLDLCHRMVLTAPIQEEWNMHQSRFARKWRVSMMARNRIQRLEIPAHQSLEKRVGPTQRDQFVAAIIEKDRRLVEAALATDKRVASLDDKVRQHLREQTGRLPEIQRICWVNPNMPDEHAIAWLKSGATAERPRTLGYRAPSSKE